MPGGNSVHFYSRWKVHGGHPGGVCPPNCFLLQWQGRCDSGDFRGIANASPGEELGLKTGCPPRVQNGTKENCDGLCNLPYQYKDTGWFI